MILGSAPYYTRFSDNLERLLVKIINIDNNSARARCSIFHDLYNIIYSIIHTITFTNRVYTFFNIYNILPFDSYLRCGYLYTLASISHVHASCPFEVDIYFHGFPIGFIWTYNNKIFFYMIIDI